MLGRCLPANTGIQTNTGEVAAGCKRVTADAVTPVEWRCLCSQWAIVQAPGSSLLANACNQPQCVMVSGVNLKDRICMTAKLSTHVGLQTTACHASYRAYLTGQNTPCTYSQKPLMPCTPPTPVPHQRRYHVRISATRESCKF